MIAVLGKTRAHFAFHNSTFILAITALSIRPDASHQPSASSIYRFVSAGVHRCSGGQTSRTKMHTCQYKTANGTCRRQMRCARSHRQRDNGENKSRVTKCGMRSRLTDNGNHVSPSRSNGNRSNKPKKNGNLDAERSARMADRHLPAAQRLRRA